MNRNVLLTGAPGVGKTTLIRKVVTESDHDAGGFYTQETRAQGRRTGFEIITLEGREATLASVDIEGQPRISKYGVDVAALDDVGVASIRAALRTRALVVIDEIGPMELLSEQFRQAVQEALDSDVPVLGTIVKRSRPFVDRIKARADVMVVEVTRENRDALVGEVREQLVSPSVDSEQ